MSMLLNRYQKTCLHLLMVGMLFLFSCKKEKLEADENLLHGQWKLERVWNNTGSYFSARDEMLHIRNKGLMELKGGVDHLNEHARFIEINEVPIHASSSIEYHLYMFSVDKRGWFSKTDLLTGYHYMHYLNEYDSEGNSYCTLYLTQTEAIGSPGDRMFIGLTGR